MQKNYAPFLLLFAIVLTDWMSLGLVYPLFSSISFHQEIHFFSSNVSETSRSIWLGVLLGIGPLAQFLSAPILGTLSDQKGRSALLKGSLGAVTIGYYLAALGIAERSLVLLLLGQLITGVGTGNISIVNAAVADLSHANTKAKNFGLIGMANGIGFAIGPFFGGQLAHWGTLKTPFLTAGTISFCNFLLTFLIFRETIRCKKTDRSSFLSTFVNLKKILVFSPIHSLFLSLFIFCIGWSFYWEFISVTWILKYNLNTSQVGHLYGYGAVCFALSSGLLIRPLLKKISGIKILFIALIALGCSILSLMWHAPVKIFLISIPLQQYLLAFLFPIVISTISNTIKENEQGEMMGVVQSLESLAFALTPLFAGVLVSVNYNIPSFVGGLLILLAAFILFWGHQKELFSSSMHPS